MDEDEGGGGGNLRKKKLGDGEVDYKEKAGTAWSHSYLNQKPWHPLSYPNQRRKWIAEQTDAQHQRRAEEVAREFAQEQEFYRQTALVSKKEKEKVEIMKAVSFMYVRPPGYNAESAKAAELEDERRRSDGSCPPEHPRDSVPAPSLMPPEEKKKSRPKDVFGRALPTEEEFEVLKNAPRMETGQPARVKPFAIEIRNVKCLRCGSYGHQSGDRECPLKDAIMPNEESRLKRDDPLTSIMAHVDSSESLKWELKQKPGISPPRGGFKPDDPNQQIVAEDIFDEYGGFLDGGSIPDLLTNFTVKKSGKHTKSKTKHKRQTSTAHNDSNAHKGELSPLYSDSEGGKSSKKRRMKEKLKKRRRSGSSHSSDFRRHRRRSEHRISVPSSSDDSEAVRDRKRNKSPRSVSPSDSDHDRHHKPNKRRHAVSSCDSDYGRHEKRSKHQSIISSENGKHCRRQKHQRAVSPGNPYYDRHHKQNKHHLSVSPTASENDEYHRRNNHKIQMERYRPAAASDDSEYDNEHRKNKHGKHHRHHYHRRE